MSLSLRPRESIRQPADMMGRKDRHIAAPRSRASRVAIGGSGVGLGFYSERVLPPLCDPAMRNRRLTPYRWRRLSEAQGRVLEIGGGSGRNLPLYGPAAREVIALEPSLRLAAMANARAQEATPVVTDGGVGRGHSPQWTLRPTSLRTRRLPLLAWPSSRGRGNCARPGMVAHCAAGGEQ
jgi:hypothetical protein